MDVGAAAGALSTWPGSLLPLSVYSVALQEDTTLDSGFWLCRQLIPPRVGGVDPDPKQQAEEKPPCLTPPPP